MDHVRMLQWADGVKPVRLVILGMIVLFLSCIVFMVLDKGQFHQLVDVKSLFNIDLEARRYELAD